MGDEVTQALASVYTTGKIAKAAEGKSAKSVKKRAAAKEEADTRKHLDSEGQAAANGKPESKSAAKPVKKKKRRTLVKSEGGKPDDEPAGQAVDSKHEGDELEVKQLKKRMTKKSDSETVCIVDSKSNLKPVQKKKTKTALKVEGTKPEADEANKEAENRFKDEPIINQMKRLKPAVKDSDSISEDESGGTLSYDKTECEPDVKIVEKKKAKPSSSVGNAKSKDEQANEMANNESKNQPATKKTKKKKVKPSIPAGEKHSENEHADRTADSEPANETSAKKAKRDKKSDVIKCTKAGDVTTLANDLISCIKVVPAVPREKTRALCCFLPCFRYRQQLF